MISKASRFLNLTLAATLVGQSAFASLPLAATDVHTPLATPSSTREALEVIREGQLRPLSLYFEDGGTADEIARFNADFDNVALANQKIKFAQSDLTQFMVYWKNVETSVLVSARAKNSNPDLEDLFAEQYFAYKTLLAKNKKSPLIRINWLQSVLANPYVHYIGYGALVGIGGALNFGFTTVRGAIVAGPAAGIVGAGVEPVVRPIREKATVLGNEYLGDLGIRLAQALNSKAGNAQDAQRELERIEAEINEARGAAHEAQLLQNSMGYDVTAKATLENMELLRRIWIKTNTVWGKVNGASYQAGRDVFTNAFNQRPQMDGIQVTTSMTAAEVAQQGVEGQIQTIAIDTGRPRREVAEAVVTLLKSIDLRDTAEESVNSEDAKAKVESAEKSLRDMGADEFVISRLVKLRMDQLIFTRNTAHALAANWLRESSYAEYNTELPPEAQKVVKVLREGYCLNYFHQQFRDEVVRIVKEMGFQVEEASSVINFAKTELGAIMIDEQQKAEAEAKASRTRSQKVADFARAQKSRVISALGRLNRVNQTAIERTGDLRAGADRSLDARAEAAVEAVGKK